MEGTPEIEATMRMISVHLQPNTERDHHYNRVYEVVQKLYREQQRKLERAITILLHSAPTEGELFLSFSNDKQELIRSIGESTTFGNSRKIRITARNIIDMENMS